MYINTNNSNQSLRIQDNNSLSEQLPTNTIQNTPIFMPFKNHFTLKKSQSKICTVKKNNTFDH